MQKAKLELPIKQFHKLHDFLGMILDYEYENYTFNLENLEIDLIEDIRHELFNQIPDELPIETTYAFTVVGELTSITPIKLYKTKRCRDGGFLITNDRGSEIFCIDKKCSHLSSDGSKDWKLITITND
jgi:hypothetical protein